jgi:hypothetical protein
MPFALQEAEPRQQALERVGELDAEEGKDRHHTVTRLIKNSRPCWIKACCVKVPGEPGGRRPRGPLAS